MENLTEDPVWNRCSTPSWTGPLGAEEKNGEMTEIVRFAQTGQYRPVSPAQEVF